MKTQTGQVVGELQKLLAEFEALAKSALEAAGDKAGNAAEELGTGLNAARERLADLEEDLGQQVKHGVSTTDRYVRDRPWMAVGIAAAVAFVLGVAVSRKD